MRVYIGYDSREDIAYQVAKYSVLKHSPASTVTPIVMDALRADGIYTRGKDLLASTAFATTRYLTPYLAGYKGYALYMDSDMLVTADVDKLMREICQCDDIPVWCVQHDFKPAVGVKMDGRRQISYPRKGWASLMLFNCEHPAVKINLTPDVINTSPIPYLNELQWTDGYEIGKLLPTWNYLVRHDKLPATLPHLHPAIIHWTYGGQWLEDQPEQDYDALWRAYKNEMAELSRTEVIT